MASSSNPLLFSVKKDTATIKKDVMTNLIKMLTNRKLIDETSNDKLVEELLSGHHDNEEYTIKLDHNIVDADDIKNFDGSVILLKILHQKVSGINKTPIIMEFIESHPNNHRILIVDEISDKPLNQLVHIPHVEVFTEAFLMIDLLSHECSPKYEILSYEQKEEVINSYQLNKKQMKKMYDSDPASKYLNLKIGQVVRIIRSSLLTCNSVDYRIIIHKTSSK
jgi:DNA-directed RNA polymerase subunit H (RpoH/RPB5)